MLLAVVPQVKQ